MSPTVALLTPSFNRENLVAKTLDSVLAQTFPDWEMIVVDDGSTDQTKAIVAEYAARDPRIKLFDRTGGPKGACTCRNEGVGRSDADYVMFLDTDDLITPFCLEQRVKAMEGDPELAFGIFPSLMFEHEPYDLALWWNIDKPEDELSRQFRQDAICQGTGVLWRREAFLRIGMWDTGLTLWQDIDLFLRAFIQAYPYRKFFDLPPDLHNRVNPNSLSRSGFFAPDKLASRAEVVRRAVALLRDHQQSDTIPQARFMVAEIISGAARSGQMHLAVSLLIWARKMGVLNVTQWARLAVMIGLYGTPLSRIGVIQRCAEAFGRPFVVQNTLGKLPYRDAPHAAQTGPKPSEPRNVS